MPDPHTLLVFAAASLALLLVPGPAVVFVVTRSVAQGRAAGFTSVLGVHLGSLVHVAFAAIGLSAVLASSATAFAVVKYAGAGYLIWLGIRHLRRRPERATAHVGEAAAHSRARLVGEGALVNVLNPKTAVFFLAFLPHFADPGRGPVMTQLAVLGGCFIALGIATDGGYAVLAGALAGRLRRDARVRGRLDRASGAVYLALGAGAALAGDGRRG